MKVRAFDSPREAEVNLKMETCGDFTRIEAVHDDGSPMPGGNIVDIGPMGIRRWCNVNMDLGFPLNDCGAVEINDSTGVPELLTALEPFVRYLKAREATYPTADDTDLVVTLGLSPDRPEGALRVGHFRALAKFYGGAQ